jgi:glycogen operon protein
MSARERWPGRPAPLGAHWDGSATNFSLFSEHATAVTLCLFDDEGREERVPVEQCTAHHWHVELPGVGPGQRYGYRVSGPWEPGSGFRFNDRKLLVDPYARAIEGDVDVADPSILPYVPGGEDADLVAAADPSDDDAHATARGVVVDDAFDWGDDRPPATPLDRSVIYELHPKGYTKIHPDVPEQLRGTYAGLAHPAVLDHLVGLGITAVELLPVHHHVSEGFLADVGLSNYWGYASIGYFAPHGAYAATGTRGQQVSEFKAMVRAMHDRGLEVILDVVYNHTAEGNHLGPMLSFKGIDNPAYYRLAEQDPRYYVDYTGTGNTLNVAHPSTLRLVMDSLRYWVEQCHVDGFRFDLAATLARGLYDVGQLSSFFDVIHQDPVLAHMKLIAEPWDVGPGGYQVGNFPVLWAEWNGVFRDTVRDFWRGHANAAGLATRIAGSPDLYGDGGRQPSASINFVTAHDGFTLADLVSYDHKHNDANGEDNRDGTDDNRSWNCGAEGPSDDPAIGELRARQQRNLLATLLLSQGVPMVVAGDEFGRTQHGNNNAWCQDNEISWVDWTLRDRHRVLVHFTRDLIALRRAEPALRRLSFLEGAPPSDDHLPDAWWFDNEAKAMSAERWDDPGQRTVALFLNGAATDDRTSTGEPVRARSIVILVNGAPDPVSQSLPPPVFARRWEVVLATDPDSQLIGTWDAGSVLELPPRTMAVAVRP